MTVIQIVLSPEEGRAQTVYTFIDEYAVRRGLAASYEYRIFGCDRVQKCRPQL